MSNKHRKNKMKNNTIGSSFNEFLAEEGLSEEAEASAIKKIIACQLQEAIEKEHLTKTMLAARLKTSRAAINRLLDHKNDSVTLLTLQKAASVLGKKLRFELV